MGKYNVCPYTLLVVAIRRSFSMSIHPYFSFPAAVALTLSAIVFSPAVLAQDSGVQSSANRNIDDETRSKAMSGGGSASSDSSSASGNETMGSKMKNSAGRAKRATVRTAKRARGAVERGAASADSKIQGTTSGAGSTKGTAGSAQNMGSGAVAKP
jgi:hypothetical protein